MKCPYCGHESNENATHCEHCYAEIPAEKQEESLVVKTRKKSIKESE